MSSFEAEAWKRFGEAQRAVADEANVERRLGYSRGRVENVENVAVVRRAASEDAVTGVRDQKESGPSPACRPAAERPEGGDG